MQQNNGVLRGKLEKGNWEFAYESGGEAFYRGKLLTSRLSGTVDEIPVIVSGDQIDGGYLSDGEITVKGSFRSRNKLVDGKSTLQLYFFIDEFLAGVPESHNSVHLEGYVCKDPVDRVTPLNREICDLLVAINRNTRRSDYLPCIAWGRNASWAKGLKTGDKVVIDGRIQSRKFTKQGDLEPNTRTAYEVSISRITRV